MLLSNKFIKSLTNRFICQQCKQQIRSLSAVSQQPVRKRGQIIPRERATTAGTNYNKIIRLEDEKRSIIKIKKDPRDKIIVLLGGESGAYVGMCETSLDDPEVYEMFQKAEQVFGWNLMDMCINGPIDELRKTKHLLPCIFMANMTGRAL